MLVSVYLRPIFDCCNHWKSLNALKVCFLLSQSNDFFYLCVLFEINLLMNKVSIFLLLVLTLVSTSCGEYSKMLQSSDYEMKYEYAKKAFEQEKYARAYTLLEDLIAIFKGTDKAEESLYLLARSYYMAGDYQSSGQYFITYYNSYPKGEYTELSRFYSGYGYYLNSPEARLDQTGTYKAISEMQMFLEYYPQSERADEAQEVILKLQEKLVEKDLENVRLYYNLGNYMGNNYKSAVISAQNILKDYPYTEKREEISMIILRSRYQEADISVDERKPERFRDVIDEYYSFIGEFPESRYKIEADRILREANKYVND